MGILKVLSLAAVLYSSAALAIRPKINAAPKVPGAYIVEFAKTSDADTFYQELGATGQAVEHRMDLKFELFKGVSFNLKNTKDDEAAAQKIQEMPAVAKIWPVRMYPIPRDEVHWTGSSKAAVPEAALLQRRQSAGMNDTFSPHVMTQVDQLRFRGVTGAGIRVAVIDTGVDYNHPALGGCFGPGCLVSFGTDLVGDNYNGANTPVPDPDPYDNCEGHGTHVSGIIAAQTNPYGFTGAAPDVTLGAYRVFGCGGSAGNDVLISAYNQAYEDGAQIITASIGGPSGWSEDPWAVAVQRIVEKGVPCTVSAGNDGVEGQFYASTAAGGLGVASIASVDNTQAPSILLNATYTVNNSSLSAFGWTQGTPADWGNVSLPLWSVNYNTNDTANACTALPDDTPDLSNYIVLVRRGTCTFVQKVTNVAAKGARYVMFYNNVSPGSTAVTAVVPGILGVGMTSAAQGAEWIRLLSSGSSVTLNIVDPEVAQQYPASAPNTATGGFLSTYTSWGPNYELEVKQQFSAPGGLILSTYPLDLGAYAVLSGTSMACPLAAAVYALVSEVRGTLDPKVLENVISATANPQIFNAGAGKTADFLAPVQQQGGGLIQAFDAAYTTTVLSVSSLSFNDTDNFVDTANFTITNLADTDVTYTLSNVPAGTFYTLSTSIFPDPFVNDVAPAVADIEFPQKEVTVPASGSVTVTIYPDLPVGLDGSLLPVYSGYIAMNGSDGSSLSLPYLGVAGSMIRATVLDTANTYLTTTQSAPGYAPAPGNATFTLPASNATASNGTVYPAVVVSLALGSPYVRMDVVPYSNSTSKAPWHHRKPKTTEFLGLKTLGNIYGFPEYYVPRGATVSGWDGLLADGTLAPPGTYQLVVSALHIFGDNTDLADYDRVGTEPFTIRYQ
ncbi:hypothetical protein B0A48_02871 [Cryoendolithus antarcticus]|uniref:Peptidase S8/S53 domain-containing protein n=1 Tax=Cryoendolithus antarcticus TaxID=1507870 RepID=A0A1V8TLI4_9PEZI|nr:hypothetical protein B0A48_02871 [Cryoendolithus antarcticus]